jgi:zinc D-Ala-D-Ala carboxypeptidase
MPKDFMYFSDRELRCRCCRKNFMAASFMEKIITIRKIAGFPFPVPSAYRCPSHNIAVSSTGPYGPHTTGHSIDIGVYGYKAVTVFRLVITHGGFTGIGINQKGPLYQRFIHLDDLEEKAGRPRPWIWTY